jgi:hypothetical protein
MQYSICPNDCICKRLIQLFLPRREVHPPIFLVASAALARVVIISPMIGPTKEHTHMPILHLL